LDEYKRESDEKLRAELEIIKAEEIARTADEIRLKEKRRLAIEKEQTLETHERLKEYARRAEELKRKKSNSDIKPFVQTESKPTQFQQRLMKERESGEQTILKSEKRVKRVEGNTKRGQKTNRSMTPGGKKDTECLQVVDEESECHKQDQAIKASRNKNDEVAEEAALAADIRKFQELRVEKRRKTLEKLDSE